MSMSKWAMCALAFAFGIVGATPAAAQNAPVEHSGNVYHVAVCAHGNPNGTARCHAHLVTDARGNPINGKVNPNAGGTPSGYGPSDLRSAYNITSNGSATTIAIVDAYGYTNAEADLGKYRAQFGLPACTTANGCFKKLNQNGQQGNYPAVNIGWGQESALDLDMASAMCPSCKLVLVEASSSTYANLATAVRTAAAQPGVTVISNSYGGGESGTTSYESAYNQPGKAVTVSTGDSGYGVQFPASSPHVIAVGGTNLVRASNSRGWAEAAWTSGGSGCSTVYAKPSFQTDALCTMRMEADVSAVADPNTGVAVYGPVNRSSSGWMVFGGTSVAAPLIGGIYGNTGHQPTGAATIYANKGSLNDVTSGSNGSCGGTYFCTAGAGYDGPTGNGTPNGTTAF
jgi:subtilase family serine protease